MYLKKVNGPRAVTLPDGTVMTRADLPDPETRRWVASRKASVVRAIDHELITREEVRTGQPEPGAPKSTPPVDADGARAAVPRGRPSEREVTAPPKFTPGDRVTTARHGHSGHTRLPGYLRDATGEVVLHHGGHVFPDANATMTGEAPGHLYAVRFKATDIWGAEADPKQTITADLWEDYLAPA